MSGSLFPSSEAKSQIRVLQVDNSLAPCCPKVPTRRGERQEHRIIDLMCVHIWYIEVQIWYIICMYSMLHIFDVFIHYLGPDMRYIYICVLWHKHWIRFSNRTSQMSTWCFLFLRFVSFLRVKAISKYWSNAQKPYSCAGYIRDLWSPLGARSFSTSRVFTEGELRWNPLGRGGSRSVFREQMTRW